MKTKIIIIQGVEGLAVCIGNIRIAGNKPWGGGEIVKEWEIPIKDIFYALANLSNPAFQPKDLEKHCFKWCPHESTNKPVEPTARETQINDDDWDDTPGDWDTDYF